MFCWGSVVALFLLIGAFPCGRAIPLGGPDQYALQFKENEVVENVLQRFSFAPSSAEMARGVETVCLELDGGVDRWCAKVHENMDWRTNVADGKRRKSCASCML